MICAVIIAVIQLIKDIDYKAKDEYLCDYSMGRGNEDYFFFSLYAFCVTLKNLVFAILLSDSNINKSGDLKVIIDLFADFEFVA